MVAKILKTFYNFPIMRILYLCIAVYGAILIFSEFASAQSSAFINDVRIYNDVETETSS